MENLVEAASQCDETVRAKFEYLYEECMKFSQRGAILKWSGKEQLLPEDVLFSLCEIDNLNKKIDNILNLNEVKNTLDGFKENFLNMNLAQNFKKIHLKQIEKQKEFDILASKLDTHCINLDIQVFNSIISLFIILL